MIIQVENKEQLNICLDIICSSFITVAEEFGLTENNCPSHTAFMTIDKLEKLFDYGKPMFLFYQDDVPVGYFSLAICNDGEWELNNLAVLPEYRHSGIGKSMVDYAITTVKNYGGNKISIGIIEENAKLKDWYLNLGFNHISTRKFEHLPFTVGFMEKKVMYKSEFCEVHYEEEYNIVFVKWKKFCSFESYREPLYYALGIIKEHKCNYVADTRTGFENHPDDTTWVAEVFMPTAVEYGCKIIYFIIDKNNSLKEELEGQESDSSDKIEFRYIYNLDEVKK